MASEALTDSWKNLHTYLVVPEDFRKDQFILKPIISKMMEALGLQARVRICMDPLLGRYGEALKWERIEEILKRYRGMIQLFLLIVDRDCDKNRYASLAGLERQAAGTNMIFLAENAVEEVEVWVLAGMADLPKEWSWANVQKDCHPKEAYYNNYAQRRGVLSGPAEGRVTLGLEAARNYKRIRQLCPQDIGRLEQRVRDLLGTRSL